MAKQLYWRIVIGIVLTNVLMTGYFAYSCPSPPVTYASEGDNVTLCWTLLPVANATDLNRFTVMALKRPVERDMDKVASANKDGTFFRWYEDNHDGLYVDRINVVADLPASMLFLRLWNYTSKMENVYCILYEMFGIDNVRTCHSQAVFLRTIGSEVPSGDYRSTVKSTMATGTNRTELRTENTYVPQSATEGHRVAPSSHKTALIIVGCLLGVVSVKAIVGFVLFYHAKKRKAHHLVVFDTL